MKIDKHIEAEALRSDIAFEGNGFDDLKAVVEAAASAAPENDIRDLQETVKVDTDAPLVKKEITELDLGNGTKFVDVNHPSEENNEDEIDKVEKAFVTGLCVDTSLFDIKDGKVDGLEEKAIQSTTDSAKSNFNLSDEDAIKLMEVLTSMRKNPKYLVYKNLPESLKSIITRAIMESGIPPQNTEMFTRMMLQELLNESGIDKELIDLEKAIDEALKIPSVADLYSEHTREVMDEIIPKTIEKIKDECPEEAAKLEAVRGAFKLSYTFEAAKSYYIENARIRKAVRKAESECTRVLDKFNYINEKSNFKMNDVRTVPEVLKQILMEIPNMNVAMCDSNGEEPNEFDLKIVNLGVEEIDIKKLMVLLCKHCENMDPCDVIDAAYMYYMMRNIIILRHTQEAKTAFAVELINNICDLITFIRDKESDFNESNLDKSKRIKKSSNNNRN